MNAGGDEEKLSEPSRLTVDGHPAGDLPIRLVMDWLRRRKDDNRTLDQYMKHYVPDAERYIYAAHQKDFVLRHNLLYLKVTPKRSNEDVLVFVVPGLK